MSIEKFKAVLIDYVVILICTTVIYMVISGIFGAFAGIREGLGYTVNDEAMRKLLKAIDFIITLVFCFLYYSHVFKQSGQTLGEKIMKIKIVPANGKRISLLSGVIRFLCLAPLLALFGIFYTKENPPRAILDYLSFTKTVEMDK